MTAKTQSKKAAKTLKQATPLIAAVIPATLRPEVEQALDACVTAFDGTVGAEGNMCAALKTLLLTIKLNDAQEVALLVGKGCAIETRYGPERAAGASICKNIVNNAVLVVHGRNATKDKPAVKGRGIAALRSAIDKVTSLRALKPAVCNAKPEALKSAAGGDRTKPEPKKPAVKPEPTNVFKFPSQKPDLFETLLSVLDFALTACDAGSDAKIIGAIEALESEVRTGAIRERLAQKKAA